MSFVLADRTKETTTTTGTGTLTLAGAVSGFQAFSAGVGNANTCRYALLDANGTGWEVGLGTYTLSGTTLARTTVLASSNSGSLITLSSGTHTVFVDFGGSDALGAYGAAWGTPPGGRITALSGIPVVDNTSVGTIYYTPYLSSEVPLWDGTKWLPVPFAETSLALTAGLSDQTAYNLYGRLSSGALALDSQAWPTATVTITSANPAVVTWTAHPGNNGDMVFFTSTGSVPAGMTQSFVYYIQGKTTNTFTLSLDPAGSLVVVTSNTGSGTITGTIQPLQIQNGRYCKTQDATRLYLGSWFNLNPSGTSTTSDNLGTRYVWNMYNQVPRQLQAHETTANWTYNSTTFRQANANGSNQIVVLSGLGRTVLSLDLKADCTPASTSDGRASIGEDSATASEASAVTNNTAEQGGYVNPNAANYTIALLARLRKNVPIGKHTYTWIEANSGGGATTFYGDDTSSPGTRGYSGLTGIWLA